MRDAVKLINKEKFGNECKLLETIDLEKLIELSGKVYDESQDKNMLWHHCQALVLRSLDKGDVDERCVAAFETYLMLKPHWAWDLESSHVFLALCYFRKYCSTGRQPDRKIGAQHFISASKCDLTSNMDIAFTLEKGMLSRREQERGSFSSTVDYFTQWWPEYCDARKKFQDVFLWPSKFKYRMPRNVRAAFEVYSKIADDTYGTYSKSEERRALNRLAMLYHRGIDGIPQDIPMAKSLYMRVISESDRLAENESEVSLSESRMSHQKDVHQINAMCNLAVLHEQEIENKESAGKSMQLFWDAIEEFENLEERLKKHSGQLDKHDKHTSSMNNLAVLMQSGRTMKRDIGEAKKLLLRAVETDKNPIAM